MKRILSSLGLTLAAFAFWTSFCPAEEQAPAPVKVQTICPVMNAPIDKTLFVDHDGKRLYVCCKGCIATVEKDPAAWIKKAEEGGVTLDKTPAETKDAAAPEAKPKAGSGGKGCGGCH